MSQEIVYTSAPKGLKPGSRGFCTVVSTEGMAGNLADRLESHSGYRHAFGVNDERREFNPVNWSHTTMRVAGTQFHVLSRVSDAGLDYSGRSNKLAHHVALDVSELPAAGPARALLAPGVIRTEWSGETGLVARRKLPEIPIPKSYQAAAWRRLAGDPAWAGVVAEKLLKSNTPLSVIFAVQTDTMSLLTEVLDLIPLKQRWSISFSTYFTQLAPGTECRLRFVLDDTSEATALRKNPHAAVIDLVRKSTAPEGGELVQCARSSQLPEHSLPPGPTTPAHCPETTSDKAPARRNSPSSAAEENHAANLDESNEQEDVGEYQLKQSEPSHTHLLGRTKKSTRQSECEMPDRPPRPLRTAWIIGAVVGLAGLVLFVSVFILSIQWLRGPGLATIDSTGPKKSALSGGIASDAKVPSEGDEKEKVGSREVAKLNSRNDNEPDAQPEQAPAPSPKLPEADPFEKLERDLKDERLAVLSLPSLSLPSARVTWELGIPKYDVLKMTLIGSDVLLNKKQAEFELIPKPDQHASNKMTWTLQLKDNLHSSESTLGEFSLSSNKDGGKLSFVWLSDTDRSPEIQLVPLLAIGLEVGKSKILCRLSQNEPTARLACKLENSNKAITSFDFRPQVLGARLKEFGSLFLLDILLPTEFPGYQKFDHKQLTELPLDIKRDFKIPLVITPETDDADAFKSFQNDEPLAYVTLQPITDTGSFSISLTAFAHIAIYDRKTFSKIQASANESETFTAPEQIDSGLSSSATLNAILSDKAAKDLTALIYETIKKLKGIEMSRQRAIAVAETAKDDTKKNSLLMKQEELKKTITGFEGQLARHSVVSFRMLRRLLLDEKNEVGAEHSARGTISGGKIGVRIAYVCSFGGKKYHIVIKEASK